MSFVGIDIGASSTRFVGENGVIGVIPNNMIFLDDGEFVDIDVDLKTTIEDALELRIKRESSEPIEDDFFPAHVLIGSFAQRYQGTEYRPNAAIAKHRQRVNYISAVSAIAVNIMKQGTNPKLTAYLALPPVEVVPKAKEFVHDHLVGKYTVEFVKFNRTVQFEVEDTMCFEESFLALLSFFFNMNGSPKESIKKYGRGNILSIDIGASTSDLAVLKDLVYVNKSGKTYKTGGNIIREYISNDVSAIYSYDITDEMAQTVISTGRIPRGNGFDDMSESLTSAKKKLAEQITTKIPEYFRAINIPIQSIRAIVVTGGGSMASSYIDDDGNEITTTKPVTDYIVDEINRICMGIDVMHYNETNPRLANIRGLFIRANLENLKHQNEKDRSNVGMNNNSGVYQQPVQQTSSVQQTMSQQPIPQPMVSQAMNQQMNQQMVQPQPMVQQVVQPMNQQMMNQQYQQMQQTAGQNQMNNGEQYSGQNM